MKTGKLARFRQHRRIFAIVALAIIIILTPLAIYLARTATSAEAAWWHEAWLYRKRIDFGNTGSAATDEFISISTDTSTLISNSKMQASCDDIRFTDANGNKLEHRINGGGIKFQDSSHYQTETSSTSYTFSHTVTSGTDQVLVVVIHSQNNRSEDDPEIQISDVTFDDVDMVEQIEHDSYEGTRNKATSIWTLTTEEGLTATTGDIDITLNTYNIGIVASAMVFENVDQYTPVGTTIGDDESTTASSTFDLTASTASPSSMIVGGIQMKKSTASTHAYNDWIKTYLDAPAYEVYSSTTDVSWGTNQEFNAVGGFQYAAEDGSHTMTASFQASRYWNGAWIELAKTPDTECNQTTTDLEIAFPSISAGDNYAYMYYGNSNAPNQESTLSDPTRTPEINGTPTEHQNRSGDTLTNPETFSYTVPTSGNNKALVVTTSSMKLTETANFIDKITYDGEELVRLSGVNEYTTNRSTNQEIWVLLDPPTGSNTVSINYATPQSWYDGENNYFILAAAMTYDNIHQYYHGNVADADSDTTGTSLTASLTTTEPNSILIGGGYRKHATTHTAVTVSSTGGTTQYQDTLSNDDNCDGSEPNYGNCMDTGGGDQLAENPATHSFTTSAANTASQWLLAAAALESDTSFDEFSPTSGPTYDTEEVTPGPIGFWMMDEGVDNTCSGGSNDVCDSSGQGNDGAITSATWMDDTHCHTGKCLYFDGSSNYVNFTGTAGTDFFERTEFSIGAWVRATAAPDGDGRIIATTYDWDATSSNRRGWTLGYVDGSTDQIYMQVYDNTGTAVSVTYTNFFAAYDDEWVHVMGTYSDTDNTIALYVNGKLYDSSSTSITAAYANMPMRIGARADSASVGEWKGYIDEVKFYPYARTAAEIKTDAIPGASDTGSTATFVDNTKSTLTHGLISYWALDDNVSGDAQTLIDSSGNDNSGTTSDGDATLDCTVSGKYGGGCDFEGNGGDDEVSFGDVDIYSSDFSLAAWINVDDCSSDECNILSKYGATGNSRFKFRVGTDNSLEFYHANGVKWKISAASVISDDTWHHVMAVFDDSQNELEFYLDGEPLPKSQQDDAFDSGFSDSSDNMQIGRADDSSDELDGEIDEVRIYNRTLSLSEARDLYNWAPGPVGYWPMDENTGISITYDKSANGNNGTLNGTMTADDWIPGVFGSALDLDGSNDNIQITDSDILDLTTQYHGFTVSGWFKHDTIATNPDYIITKSEEGTNGGYKIFMASDGDIVMEVDGDSTWDPDVTATTTAATYDDDTWHHFSGVFDLGIDLYIDGILTATSAIVSNAPTTSNNDDVYIGVDDDGTSNDWAGSLDEIKIYNYARTSDQVVEDMNGNHPIGGSPIGSEAHYWNMDEMSGTTINDSGTEGLNGTFDANAPDWTTAGKNNGAIDCTAASSDHIDLGDIVDSGDQLTISAWIYPNSIDVSNNGIIGESNAFRIWTDTTDTFKFFIKGNPSDTSATLIADSNVLSTGTWQHVAAVWNGANGTWNLYVNGIQVGDDGAINTVTSLDGADAGGGTICDYYNGAGAYFNGLIDEVKVFNAALTPDQMKIVYNAGSATNFGTGTNERDSITDGDYMSSLVGYWPLDENTGTSNTYEKSGNNLTSTLGGIAESAWQPGKYGSGLDIQDNDYVNNDSSPYISTVTDALTVSGWIKPSTTYQVQRTIARHATSWWFYYNDFYDYLVLTITLSSSNYEYESTADLISFDEWNHVATSYDGDVVNFYVNGVLTDEVDAKNGSLDAGTNALLYLGAANTTSHELLGTLDDLKVFDSVLTPAQIAYEYNRGKPIGWWQFDECQGTTAYDYSAHGNNGTLNIDATGTYTSAGTCDSGTAAEAWNAGTTGKYGASLAFDGTDDYVSMTDIDDFEFTSNFSVSAWVKPTNLDTTDEFIASKGGGAPDGWAVGIKATTDVATLTTNSTYVDGSTVLTDDNWYHLAYTVDESSYVSIYVNGILDNTPSAPTFTTNTTSPVAVGAYYSGGDYRNFEGNIDDVRIYNYELSANQIKQTMSHGTARFE